MATNEWGRGVVVVAASRRDFDPIPPPMIPYKYPPHPRRTPSARLSRQALKMYNELDAAQASTCSCGCHAMCRIFV